MTVQQPVVSLTIGGTSYTPRRVSVTHSYDQVAATFELELGDDASAITVNDVVNLSMGYVGDTSAIITGGYVDEIERRRPPGTYIVRGRDKLKLVKEYLPVPSAGGEPVKTYTVPVWDNVIVEDLLTDAGISAGDISTSQVFQFTQPTNSGDNTIEFGIGLSASDIILQVARAAGGRLWCQYDGTVKYAAMRPIPGDATANVGTLSHLSLRWTKTDVGMYNHVTVLGSDSDIIGTATAANSLLPSGFTKRAIFDFANDFNFTQAEADSLASTYLSNLNQQREWADALVVGNYNYSVENAVYVTDSWMGLNAAEFFIYSSQHTYTEQEGYRTSLRLHRWVAPP